MAVNFQKSLVRIAIVVKRVLCTVAKRPQRSIALFLLVTLLIVTLLTPNSAMAVPAKLNTNQLNTNQLSTNQLNTSNANPTAIIAVSQGNHTTFTEEKITPQERQELQAVRQRRNRELIQVLNKSQRRQLKHFLRSGQSLENSIEALDLEREQWDTIQAILELSELKIKGILYRHSLPMEPS
jgi:predicted metallo-beta-lactamase superfamily hydrolase